MVISYILIGLFVLIDFITKQIFSNIYNLNELQEIIPGILNFGYVQNTGASFGMLAGKQFLFFIITIIALLIFGYFFSKSNIKTKKVYTIALILLISGTLGNAIDRLLYGYVIDFVQMPFLPIVGSTIFNVADIFLNFGVAMLFIDIIILDYYRSKKSKEVGQNEEN
ncbi:signal peptidase II [Acholeplasma granularum]|uniref:signal peptidase II n=1 Tax=Acholeplasma granularum TaxID=264635 RepID=UPI000472ACD4|nr:signal peptidase II [Acholeplasma granularum]